MPLALKVAKADLNRESLSNLPMKEKVPLGYHTNLDHWQVAHRFVVQNLTLPPSMPVAKVAPRAIEKIKILGAVLELPAK